MNTFKTAYAEKLKDPRWQKCRLLILERDNFTCRLCGDDKTTLHVHHWEYQKGREPWEHDDVLMVCICAICHSNLHKIKEEHGTTLYELAMYDVESAEVKMLIRDLVKYIFSNNSTIK